MPFLQFAAAALALPSPAAEPRVLTAEQAVENFHEHYRLARAGICRTGAGEDEVVVCGERIEESPYRMAGSGRAGGYRPPPPGSSLFDLNLGPVRIGCCAISTRNGSGAGLSITMGF